MSDVVTPCPQCSTPVLSHCDHCSWLACTKCKVLYGKNAYIRYAPEPNKKKQNGV